MNVIEKCCAFGDEDGTPCEVCAPAEAPPAVSLTSETMPPRPPLPTEDEPPVVTRNVGNVEAEPKPSWQPVDIRQARADAEDGSRAPTILRRQDNVPLLYRGRVNALVGESESGKSWVALAACAEVLDDGGTVAFLDFESDEVEVTDRLFALGADEDAVYERFTYVRPEVPGTIEDFAQYVANDLVVIDGITEAMTLYSLSPDLAVDYAEFHATLCKPLTKGGAAVLTLDHVVKAKDNRGTYATGTQHKKSSLDGTQIIVEPVESFGRGKHGMSRLIVGKDRRGYVRKYEVGKKKVIGMFNVNSLDDLNAEVWIEAPDDSKPKTASRPTDCMEAVSRFIEDIGRPVSKGQIESEVVGYATKTIRWARDELVQAGHIKQEDGPRNAILNRLVEPYRAEGLPL